MIHIYLEKILKSTALLKQSAVHGSEVWGLIEEIEDAVADIELVVSEEGEE